MKTNFNQHITYTVNNKFLKSLKAINLEKLCYIKVKKTTTKNGHYMKDSTIHADIKKQNITCKLKIFTPAKIAVSLLILHLNF